MGLCLYDIISLSITRIWVGISGMARDGTLSQEHCFFTVHYFRLTVKLSSKFNAEQGWNTTLDFPQIKTVFIAIFLCASIQYDTLTLPESM